MKIIAISGNDFGEKMLKEAGVYGAIIVFAFLFVLIAGRTLGFIDIVGFQWLAKAGQFPFTLYAKPISVTGPAYLRAGEKLIATYDAQVGAGGVYIQIRKGLFPTRRDIIERHTIESSGNGRYEFTASQDGFYWPKSRIRTGGAFSHCRDKMLKKDYVQNTLKGRNSCAKTAVTYTLVWTVD